MLRDLAVATGPARDHRRRRRPRRWAAVLTGHAAPYCGPLSDLLSRAAPPDTRRGAPTVSETLVDALRVLDQAAINAEHSLDRAAFFRGSLRHANERRDGIR